MMSGQDVLAVVVSFNGRAKTLRTIACLSDQVDRIIVVDNHSDDDSCELLRGLESDPKVEIVWLSANLGIGNALNIGLSRALEMGSTWLLTMDQDSMPEPDMVAAFLASASDNPDHVCLTPSIDCLDYSASMRPSREVNYAITSGNMTLVDLVAEAGSFDEKLFIDGVDFDFSLRIRKLGKKIYQVRAAKMMHELGDRPSRNLFLGRFHTFHSPLRRYYISRNFFTLSQRYGLDFPIFFIKLLAVHSLLILTIGIYGSERITSFKMMLRGFSDFLRGRSGQIDL